jgi:hypothetical protein
LSCAEYHWKDIEKLLNATRNIAGESPIELGNITNKVKDVNDYCIIIQEYVQARVTDFFENYANRSVLNSTLLYQVWIFQKSWTYPCAPSSNAGKEVKDH